LGLNWSGCSGCGVEFIWRRKDLDDDRVFVAYDSARDYYESPSWVGVLAPAKCDRCDPAGYVVPAEEVA
jgi:hypothetical protein